MVTDRPIRAARIGDPSRWGVIKIGSRHVAYAVRAARARARGGSENHRPWPADKVERWSIDRLIPYAKNARTHSDAQIEWGWTTPALVGEDGGLIAGHARILAARQLGIAEIPVMVAAG